MSDICQCWSKITKVFALCILFCIYSASICISDSCTFISRDPKKKRTFSNPCFLSQEIRKMVRSNIDYIAGLLVLLNGALTTILRRAVRGEMCGTERMMKDL